MLERLSVVVPTLNAGDDVRRCLEALEGVGQMVVVDGGSSDETREIAARAGAKVITSDPGRGVQLRNGVAEARGDWLLFLHADTFLGDGWRPAVASHMGSEPHRAGYFRLRLRSDDPRARLIERGAALRCKALGLPFGDQGLLVSKALYEQVGGYAAIALMEDVDLVRRLGRRCLVPLPADALTSASRWERDGWVRRSLGNVVLGLLYFAGASPDRLARLYR
ncbi:MAG: TIGR04283 family arsenosugar biosynthesis glycosyltransferase [Sphingomonas sp.]|nr:TIGR04283 family arsenosugar biosynthesis glycosyltransferase [Sphingomonas sp.]